MRQVKQKDVLKNVNRFTISIVLNDGTIKEIEAVDFIKSCLFQLAKKPEIVRVSYKKK